MNNGNRSFYDDDDQIQSGDAHEQQGTPSPPDPPTEQPLKEEADQQPESDPQQPKPEQPQPYIPVR